MPAEHFTKKADTPAKKRQWQHVYESKKKAGASAKDAVIAANAVIKNRSLGDVFRRSD